MTSQFEAVYRPHVSAVSGFFWVMRRWSMPASLSG
jgi:hypothetical protein